MTNDWFTEDPIDQYTDRIVNLALQIAKVAEENNKEYFIGGGLAIDFFLGKISRNHHDIDFHPMLKDSLWWMNWFKEQGYNVWGPADQQFKETYKVSDDDGEEIVDMWPLKLKKGILLIMYNGEYVDSWRKWDETKIVQFKGINVRVENPERVLEQKQRHSEQNKEVRKQDQHDFHLLGKELQLTN